MIDISGQPELTENVAFVGTPKKKSDRLLKVEKVKVNITYYTKLFYKMSKEINSLLNTNCYRTLTYNRRSHKNAVTNRISLTTNLIQVVTLMILI